jgi:UDP-N-acetylglucosamine:LPS N-acetylglucosamine transferase
MKILLTATGGGHLEQLKNLYSLKNEHQVTVVVCKNKVNSVLKDVEFIPDYRNERKVIRFFDLARIFIKSFFLLCKFKPDCVISTGAGATYPLLWLQKKWFRKKVIFIESFARRTSASKTGKRVYKFADHFIVQWEELKEIYPNAIYGGMIY